MNASILTIGNELLQGFTLDTNSFWLAKTLHPYNIQIRKILTVSDDVDDIVNETKCLLEANFDFIFITGGLGPTHDDVTKKAVCKIFYDEMYFDKDYFIILKSKFESISKNMPEINRTQAMLLKKAISIPNNLGSALGLHYIKEKTNVFIMPGVPIEMKEMVKKYIIPEFINHKPINKHITIKTAGIMESHLAERIKPLIKHYASSFRFAFLPSYTGVSFRIWGNDDYEALIKAKNDFFINMQPYSYGFDDDTLEYCLAKILTEQKMTIAVAESCTGGLIGKKLTNFQGSSKYFLGGITAYSNKLKTDLLNIPSNTLKKYGAVSEQVALEMAINIRRLTNADIGLSTTGISGPDNDKSSKPVGLVYIGYVSDDKSIVKKNVFPVKRNIHREMTAISALNITRLNLA